MISELTKSFVRSIGRILAYIFIGFLLFVFIGKVKADTIISNDSRIQSIKSDWSVGFTCTGTSCNDYSPGALGFQWSPYVNSDYYPLKASEYYINLQFIVAYNTYLLSTIKPNFSIAVGSNNTTATCDGFEDLIISDRAVRNNQLYITYDYVCDSLIVTQDFDRIRFRENMSSIQNNLYQVQIFIMDQQIIDVNDLNPDTPVIIDSITNNTDRIIESQNEIKDQMNIFQQAMQGNWTTTINSNNQIKNSVDNINSSINNSSIDNPNSSFTGFNNNVASTQGIESIFLLPVTLFQTIINSNSGSCSAISFGSLYGTNLSLPCVNIENYLGSSIYTIIDLFCSLALILGLRKYVLEIFNKITSLKEDNLQ